jgi:hypothetical protein
MIHFMPQLGVYVYERNWEGKSVLVFLNGANKEINLPLERYAEVIRGKTHGTDVIAKRSINLEKDLPLKAKEVLIIELGL